MATVPFSKTISAIYFPPLCGINWAFDGSCIGANQLQGAAVAGGSHFVAGSIGGADLSPNILTVSDKEYRVALSELNVSSNGTVALARNAQGDWSLNQTAGGAETTYVAATLHMIRTSANKGVKITGFRVAYELGTVDATSVDVVADKTQYAQAVDPVVTNNFGGAIQDANYDSNHNTAAKRKSSAVANGEHLMTVTLANPVYLNAASQDAVFEFKAVLANTGTLKVRYVAFLGTESY